MERALPPTDSRRTLPQLSLATLLVVAIFDFLFWDHVIGFTPAIFTLVATALLIWTRPRALEAALPRAIIAGLVTVSAATCIEPTTLGVALSWFGLASLGLVIRNPQALSGTHWPSAWLGLGSSGWLTWIGDFATLRSQLEARAGWRGRLGAALGRWGLPLLLSVPFVLLFGMANPLIEIGFDDLFEAIGELLGALSFGRIALWMFVFAGVWALLRFQPGLRARTAASPVPSTSGERLLAAGRSALGGDMLIRCLAVFNALFAIQTGLDLGYFWSGFALPEGMTYAEYAHRGAYPLVATTLLAILFILVAFHDAARETSVSSQRRLAARLVYLWLAQNAFLLGSAAARLDLYIDVYLLTYFRIASVVWMFLIACGLALTAFKIATHRSNAWLIDVNLATAAIVLTLCCFPNFDRVIADYNVEQAIERGDQLDIWYLRGLGPDALPALRRYAVARALGEPSEQRDELIERIEGVNQRQLTRLQRREADWRGFSFRQRALSRRLDRSWKAPRAPQELGRIQLPRCSGRC